MNQYGPSQLVQNWYSFYQALEYKPELGYNEVTNFTRQAGAATTSVGLSFLQGNIVTTDLTAFGRKLRELRRSAGLTQEALALSIPVSCALLSKWERGYTYKKRDYPPSQPAVLRLINIFADHLTPSEAEHWAGQAGYDLSLPGGERPPSSPRQIPPLPDFYVHRTELEQTICTQIRPAQGRTLVLLGPGGAGKTTLAAWAAQTLVDGFPDGVVWVEAQPGQVVQSAQEWWARSFGLILGGRSPAERAAELRSFFHQKECLLVLDDLWAEPNLDQLRVMNEKSRLLVTSRDDKVPSLLGAMSVYVGGLTQVESRTLLSRWARGNLTDHEPDELVTRLGGLPLALCLSGAQLQAGETLSSLLDHFQQEQADLSLLDLDDPETRAESLTLCFDVSYRRLSPTTQQRFAQLGCFAGSFSQAAGAALWATSEAETHQTLQRLQRFALLERSTGQPSYQLHPLLRDYARQKLADQPELERLTCPRHVAWSIRYGLYHPAVLDDVTAPAPDLRQNWADILAGVKWGTHHAPRLAAQAALLAHTERPALLAEVGPDLINAVTTALARDMPRPERAMLYELLGELYLLKLQLEDGLTFFDQARVLWEAAGDWLAASRAVLRQAGTYLLRQSQTAAAAAARQAQNLLAKGLPLVPDSLETARWLFYWFDMIYNPLVRWPDLPEADVSALARLAEQTGHPILAARGWHIYRLWCTAPVRSHQVDVRAQGRQLALRAYQLWRRCGQTGRADEEVSWAGYLINGRYSERAAARFARRLSETTPRLDQVQIRLVKNEGVNWWLAAHPRQRVAWLSRMLPRYLKAANSPAKALSPGSRAWQWVNDILNIGMLGSEGRLVTLGHNPPLDHLLNGPEWRVLSGQKALPLVGPAAVQLVERYLVELERELS